MTSEISRDEVRSAIEDKLCAHFGITSADATDDQVFQASAMSAASCPWKAESTQSAMS